MMKKQYIGDGVYVEYIAERNMLCLTVEDGVHKPSPIYLERNVWEELKEYVEQLHKELNPGL